MKTRILSRTVLMLALSACCISLNAATIFSFESDALGISTGFTDTVSGLSATFSSPADPGGFTIAPSFFSTLTSHVLLDPGPVNANNLALTILFSSAVSDISMLFATNSQPGVPLVLNAFNGATFVGTASASGAIPLGFTFPEGSLSFSGSPFNRVVLSSVALDFAIDNVSATAVPEPASLVTLGLGVALLVVSARRKWLLRAT
jgi:hypothetical protein